MAVEISSSFTPPITVDFKKNAAAPPTSPVVRVVLGVVRPAVDVDVPLLGRLHLAPWGEPDAEMGGRWIFIGGTVLLVVLFLAGVGAWGLARRSFHK